MLMRHNVVATLAGKAFRSTVEVETDGLILKDPTLAAAKTGTLTTRTDDNTGTITGQASHGIGTGERFDAYWVNADGTIGRQYGIIAGTVAGTSIPFDSGVGDNLPLAATALTLMKPQLEAFAVTGNNVTTLMGSCASLKGATAVITDGADAVLAVLEMDGPDAGSIWFTGNGVTNPLAGDVTVRLYLSHGDSANSHEVCVASLYN